jgi:hypothetical protein
MGTQKRGVSVIMRSKRKKIVKNASKSVYEDFVVEYIPDSRSDF